MKTAKMLRNVYECYKLSAQERACINVPCTGLRCTIFIQWLVMH